MENNAVIKICTNQIISGEDEKIELETPGKFAIRNNKVYIIYKESEMTGYEDTVTTIKISDGLVDVSRKGKYPSRMTYNLGERTLCLVDTPYGQIGASVETKDIRFNFDENGGNLSMNYIFDADNKNFINNEMEIKVKKQ